MKIEEIKVHRDLQDANEAWAGPNRELLAQHKVVMLNLIGSPGSGKTTLLESVVARLADRLRFAVLEGDVETTKDAERLFVLGVPVIQLITGSGCHLNAKLINTGLQDLPLADLDLVLVENVGNLVCPAQFDIGETAKVAVLSVTEGEEKPAKYPMLFRGAKAAVLTKIDLLPYLRFDMPVCLENLRAINNELPVFPTSATTGEGLEAWLEWVVQITQANTK
jgi:hydrogenase nickel incorporation protein HypB